MRLIILFLLILVCCSTVNAEDLLMTRDGNEYKGKLVMISDKGIQFRTKSKSGLFRSDDDTIIIPADQVYMIKTEKRGSIFFDRKRERKVLPTAEIGRRADLIYLIDGEEIPAWNLGLENGIITYQKDPRQKRAMSNIGAYPVEEVFMVKYDDGSKDIFTDISGVYTEPEAPVTQPENKRFKVIMYNAASGDTLGSIAEKFGVKVDEIKEWNDLSSKSDKNTKPASGQQLMIQVPID